MQMKHQLLLARYGKKYEVYSAFDIIMSAVYKILPEKMKAYPLYSIKRMKNKYFDSKKKVYDFNGILIPDIPEEYMLALGTIYIDEFHIHCKYNDKYDSIDLAEYDLMAEGPYCYPYDDKGNVMIEKGDFVVDAGAWIGDFSAYAAYKGAEKVYAFEIDSENIKQLNKTADLNKGIVAVNAGVGDEDSVAAIQGVSNAAYLDKEGGKDGTPFQEVRIVSLDSFVKENNVPRIDFIKADIEGFERNMLQGAKGILNNFAPKLSICTYHLHDDPQILADIILGANPNYFIVQRKHKLCAWVPNRTEYLQNNEMFKEV